MLVFTDHKPIESIFNKRHRIFQARKDIPVADALLRLHHEDELEEMTKLREEIYLQVHLIIKAVPIGDQNIK